MSERALAGLRVVVTRPEHQSGSLGRLLAERGADTLFLPVIAIAPPASWERIDAAIDELVAGSYDWVLFTSANGVRSLLGRAAEPAILAGTRVAAVGSATASALGQHDVRAELIPKRFTAASLVRTLGRGPGAGRARPDRGRRAGRARPDRRTGRVLLPRVAGASDAIVRDLRALGWEPVEVACYRNVPPPPSSAAGEVTAGHFDVVTLTSGSTARNFAAMVGALDELGLGTGGDKIVACIGPETATVARGLGYGVDVVAGVHTAAGLVDALSAHMRATRMAP